MKKRITAIVMAAALALGMSAVPGTGTHAFAADTAGASSAETSGPPEAADTGAVFKASSSDSGDTAGSIFEEGFSLFTGEARALPAVTAGLLGLTDGNVTIDSFSYETYDDDILEVSENGGNWTCRALKQGYAMLEVSYTYTVTVTDEDGYTDTYTESDSRDISVNVTVNMDQVSLPSSAAVYDTGYDTGYEKTGTTAKIPITGAAGAFDDYADYKDPDSSCNFDISISGTDLKLAPSWDSSYMNTGSYIAGDTLYVPLSGKGTGVITLVLNGRTYQIRVTVYKVRLDGAVLLAKGKTKTLKVSGIKASKVQWSSDNKKAVSVNKKTGKIKARKNGNALVYAKIGSVKLGTVVSVTSAKKVKAVNYGFHIAKTCSYSQSRRMEAGYYDCSALVWKAYRHAKGCNFGSSSYAPTAAGEAKYLAGKKKIIGKYTEKNQRNMKFQAGDVLFKTDYSENNNGRYKGIYHAELFAGYVFCGFDWDGSPLIRTRWCARENGYGGGEEDIVGRP